MERSGVRIDACRQCRGVWLDRGELERILEQERRAFADVERGDDDFIREVTGQSGSRERKGYGLDRNVAERIYRDYGEHRRHKKKRKSFLDELFD